MVERPVDPLRPSLLKSHAKNRSTLEETYFQLIHSWQIYKEDLKLSDDAFNAINEEGVAVVKHNDAWFEAFQES